MGRRALAPGAPFDHVVVAAIVDNRPFAGRIAPGDAWEITRRLARRGFSDGQIAYRLRYGRRQVARIRQAFGIPAPCRGLSGLTRPIQGEPTVPGKS